MAASLAVMAAQSSHSAGSMGSGRPARPSWWDMTWPTVMACFPAWANAGQTLATVWS